MVRLPVLTRLARRHPIVLPFLAEPADAAETPLPESLFVNNKGELLFEKLLKRPYWSSVQAYCCPSLHPAGLLIAAGSWYERINGLIESGGREEDLLDEAGKMLDVALHCQELASAADEVLPLQVYQLNWLGFAVAVAGLPQAALALYELLQSWQVCPIAAIAVLAPGIRHLAQSLDEHGDRWRQLQYWVASGEAVEESARRHLETVRAGLQCVFEAAGVLLNNPNRHARRDVVDFILRARRWQDRGMSVLTEAGMPWEAHERMTKRLDRLAQWVESTIDQGLPDYFGFPYIGKLPAIRVHERLGSLYLAGNPSPFFRDERFQFEALLLADTFPLLPFLESYPGLLTAVQEAGGERTDFYQLGERFYDQLDVIRNADPDAPWNEERSRLFVGALSCRALALVRACCSNSANDLHTLLERYIEEEEQSPWVSAATALLVFAPLVSVLDEALSVESDGYTLRVIGWINQFRSFDTRQQAVGRAKLQQLRFAGVSVCRLLNDGREMLVEMAGEHQHAALQARVGDLVEDLRVLTELPEMGMVLGTEGGTTTKTFLEQAQRLYQRACGEHMSKDKPAKTASTPEPKTSSAKSASASAPEHSAPVPAQLVQIVHGKVLETHADSRYLKEQWSVGKAEQLKKGVELLPGRPEQVRLLRDEFPWFEEVLDFIETWLLRNAALGIQSCQLPPMLLVGGVGCGKTHFGRRLAETLEVPFQMLAAGGSTDNRQLAGTSRGWGTAFPSLPVDFMSGTGVGNGLLVVDEVDKESPDRRNGRMTDTLLQLLEPANARHFSDPFIGAAVDCSHLQWVLTANSLRGVHEALLSRVRLFAVRQPSRDHYPKLAQQIRLGFAKDHQVDHRLLPMLDGDDLEAIRNLCKSVRQVRQVTEWLLTKRIVEEQRNSSAH